MTEDGNVANKPDGIINLGIITLKEHRRKGYAASVCAAFIEHNEKQGLLPLWQCDFDNLASRSLAERLGLRHMGNMYSISTLSDPGCAK